MSVCGSEEDRKWCVMWDSFDLLVEEENKTQRILLYFHLIVNWHVSALATVRRLSGTPSTLLGFPFSSLISTRA